VVYGENKTTNLSDKLTVKNYYNIKAYLASKTAEGPVIGATN